ncbi:MAG: hypothetical protein Q9157_004320 [Trypethelium eluteriae]
MTRADDCIGDAPSGKVADEEAFFRARSSPAEQDGAGRGYGGAGEAAYVAAGRGEKGLWIDRAGPGAPPENGVNGRIRALSGSLLQPSGTTAPLDRASEGGE